MHQFNFPALFSGESLQIFSFRDAVFIAIRASLSLTTVSLHFG